MTQQPPPYMPPGWYPDPQMANTVRYWNGRGWTQDAAPMNTPAAQVPKQDSSALIAVGIFGGLFLPILGWIIGVVLLARNEIGGGIASILFGVVSFYVWFNYLNGV